MTELEKLENQLDDFKYYYFTKRLPLENLSLRFKVSIETVKDCIKRHEFSRPEYKDGNEISREEIYTWYIVQDGNYKEAPQHFGISRWKFEDLCRKYNIKKDRHKTGHKGIATKYLKYGGRDKYEELRLNHLEQKAIEKYGSMEEYNRRKSETCKKKWQEEYHELLEKIYETKKKNDSFNSSSPEEIYKEKLISKYGKENVLTQYSDERYPFKCDFYIKSEDLFIELNLHWTHGEQPYNENNERCQQKLNLWKEKAKESKFFQNAIETWTVRDVYKLKIAKENNLNIKIIYDYGEVYD